MSYHNIEVKIEKDDKNMILKGQIYHLGTEGAKVTIFKREGDNIYFNENMPYSATFEEFQKEMALIQESCYFLINRVPRKYSIKINITEGKIK